MQKTQRFGLQIILAFFTCVFITGQLAWSLSNEMNDMLKLETESNAVSVRVHKEIKMPHLEIPLRMIKKDLAARLNPAIAKSLIFSKDGEEYFRWVINPEDTQYTKVVQDFLTSKGLSAQLKYHFLGYQTASRSYVVVDPVSHVEFSTKASTNVTGGHWKSKKQTLDDALQVRMITDYVHDMIAKTGPLEHIILLDEPAIFGLPTLDQAIVIRDYSSLTGSGHRFVPGFSILHDKTGAEIAKLNGSDDPAAYWDEHYNKPLARAIAEFTALTGLTYDSPHSQNFLVELDEHNKPTGKIVLRDFGDTRVQREFFSAAGREDIFPKWEAGSIRTESFYVLIGVLHGNTPPSWIDLKNDTASPSSYSQWGRDFFAEYRKEFARQTGVDLNAANNVPDRSWLYISQYFKLHDEPGERFLNLVKTGHQRSNGMHLRCEALFKNI